MSETRRRARPASLGELPAPPAGRKGWPWTVGSESLSDCLPDGRPWPRFTVVTPTLNQAEYLEETLRSVLLQGYPDLEYIVVDGGSTDRTLEIIERYSPWLDRWVSEPDRGQSDAINKGFRMSTGRLRAWLNSDDSYYPGVLGRVGQCLRPGGPDIVFGAMDKVTLMPDASEAIVTSLPTQGEPMHMFPILPGDEGSRFHFFQPAMFWTDDIWSAAGELDERYHYVMDLEWCNRALAKGARVETMEEPLARFTLHPGSKSQEYEYRFARERVRMYLELARRPHFRTAGCLLSVLKPMQRLSTHGYERCRREGRILAAAPWRVAALSIKGLRRLPGLGGAPHLQGSASASPRDGKDLG